MIDKKDDTLKLALEAAANYIDALGGDSRKYRQALVEQPAISAGPITPAMMQGPTPEQKAQMVEAMSKLAEQPAQQQEWVADVGMLEYKGNSVAYIHQKMKAYRNGIDTAWDAMRAKGVHPDGKTSLADMIAKHISPQPSKPWAGLTPTEVHDIWCYNHTPQEVCDAVSAKLREKNQ